MVFQLDVAGRDGNVITAGLHRTRAAGACFDPDDAAHIIASSPGGELRRHTRAGGTERIWKSNNDGETGRAVSVELDGSPVSLHVSRDGSCRVYAGTEWGAVFCSAERRQLVVGELGRHRPAVSLHHQHQDAAGRREPCAVEHRAHAAARRGQPYAHLYLSTDGGRTWRSADPDHELPNASHNCVVIDEGGSAYVATDFGVYRGDWLEEGQQYLWTGISGDLPKAFVTDLVLHAESKTLTAGTYGRSIFRYRLGSEVSPGSLIRKLDQEEFESSNL